MERYQCATEWVREAGERLRRLEEEPLNIREKKGHQDIVTVWDGLTEQFLRERIRKNFPQDRIVGEELSTDAGNGSKTAEDTMTWYIDPIDGTTNFASQRRDFAISVGCASGEGTVFGIVLDVMNGRMYGAEKGRGAWIYEDGNGQRSGTGAEGEAGSGRGVGEKPESRAEAEKELESGTTAVGESRDAGIVRRRIWTSDTAVEQMLITFPCVTDMYLGDYDGKAGIVRLSQDVRGVRGKGSMALELCQVAAGEMQLCIARYSCPWDHNAARLILKEAGGYICRMDGEALPYEEKTSLLAGSSRETVELVLREYLGKADRG